MLRGIHAIVYSYMDICVFDRVPSIQINGSEEWLHIHCISPLVCVCVCLCAHVLVRVG